jgi:hypothetical protein
MTTKAKTATIEEIAPTGLGEVFDAEELDFDSDESEDGTDEDDYEDDEVVVPAELAEAEAETKTRKTRTPRQYIATDDSYDWVLKVEATSISAATRKVLDTPDLGLQAGSRLIIAEIKLDTQLRVTFGV